MSRNQSDPFVAERWNACVDLLCQPIDELNAVQRPAALAFRYYGRVMNGGHSLHFDYKEDALDQELLNALHKVGAAGHAAIFKEVLRRRREVRPSTQEEEFAEAEFVETSLDAQFDKLKPHMIEILRDYIERHREHFPK